MFHINFKKTATSFYYFRCLHSGSLCIVYYEQGSFSLVCFHGWLNYPVRNNHLYSFYTRLKLQWIVDHIISYIWLLSICGSQKTQLDSFFSHQSNIYIQSKSSAIIYPSEFLKNSNIRKGKRKHSSLCKINMISTGYDIKLLNSADDK